MALATNITLKDLATPALVRLGTRVRGPEIRSAMGGAVRRELRRHLRDLDSKKANRLGGRRTNFYGRAAAAVQVPQVIPDGVRITINHLGLAQRFYGGTIESKPGGPPLTIPVHPDAHGRRAREFDDLIFIRQGPADSRAAKALLMRPVAGSDFGEVLYLLKRRVVQKADPEVLPAKAVLSRAAIAAADAQAKVIIAREK